jgi:uncharacterized coiled-coil protein SlyX
MANSVEKLLCAICNVRRGVFQCHGCSQFFCLQHTANHHQAIVEQLIEVEQTFNVVQNTLRQEINAPQVDVEVLHEELIKKIDDWQEESIRKIQEVATKAKQDALLYTTGRLTAAQTKLEQLNGELQQAQKNTDLLETDLRLWTEKLQQLNDEVTKLPPVNVVKGHTKLVSDIRVVRFDGKEIFERSSGKADFEEGGKVVSLTQPQDVYTEIRGKYEYTTGRHTIALKVEQLTGWILFGIISKSTALQVHSYTSPSCYGWYNGSHFVYTGGQCVGGQGSDVAVDDTIQLVIDCNNRLIQLINERTGQKLELAVDVEKCPYPWQLHLNLNEAPTRVRIASSAH